jgi:hypothetical protein
MNFSPGLRTHVLHGRVVDEETGLPLARTVVTVIWSRSSYLGYEPGPNEFLNAQETVTDSNGNFTLQASSGLNWEPYTTISEPWIVMYQPGYEPLTKHNFGRHGFETTDALLVALKNGVTVKLRKLRKEEVGKYVNRAGVVHPLDTPLERIPNLIGAINGQRKMAAFQPYVIETPQKGKLQ